MRSDRRARRDADRRREIAVRVAEKREALAEAKAARDLRAAKVVAAEVEGLARAAERALAEGFRTAGPSKENLASLVPRLGELRFYRRFLEEVSALDDEIGG